MVAGLLITAALVYWVLSGISLADVARHLRAARPGPLLAAVVIATSS